MTKIPVIMTSGPPIRPSHVIRRGTNSDRVHQVPQDDSVGETREEARPNQERSTIGRNERLTENRSGGRRRILPHQQERQGADEPDGDEHGLDQTR
jgi:hypothetical protein